MITYQWKRCDAFGASPVAVAGATGPNYVLAAADLGSTMRVTVNDGVTTATSGPTAVIGAVAPPGPTPSGYYWLGDYAAGGQDFTAFDTHDMHLLETINDPTVGLTKGAVIVPMQVDNYPASQYACRCVVSNDFGSSSLSGAVTVPWMGGTNYGQAWVQQGAETWFRTRFLIPDGTNPSFPGRLVPVPGDGVSSTWHIPVEWHQNNDYFVAHGGGGPTSTQVGIYKASLGTSMVFKPLGGLNGHLTQYYIMMTDKTQTKANSIAGSFTGVPNGTVQPLRFNHWYDMLFYFVFDPDPTIGYIEWWVDGVKVFGDHLGSMVQAANGVSPGVGFEGGLYRGGASSSGGGVQTNTFNEILYQGMMGAGPTPSSLGA